MLVNSSRSSTDSSVSSTHSNNANNNNLIMETTFNITPSTIIWTQTLESITLHIQIVSMI